MQKLIARLRALWAFIRDGAILITFQSGRVVRIGLQRDNGTRDDDGNGEA